MKNVVIVTAKGSNTTIQNKNLIPIQGKPCLSYPIQAARFSDKTDAIFMSTEDPVIKKLSEKEGIRIIDRPAELSTPTSLHCDVILHAVQEVDKLHPEAENFIVLLGNTVHISHRAIDQAFGLLEEGNCDSVATVWKAQDDHPFRALVVNENGFGESYLKMNVGSNRQSYPSVYFYDQGVWAFKKKCAYEQKGPTPWVWLGEKCFLLERPWVTGRDIHSWIDVAASVFYLNDIQVNDIHEYPIIKPGM